MKKYSSIQKENIMKTKLHKSLTVGIVLLLCLFTSSLYAQETNKSSVTDSVKTAVIATPTATIVPKIDSGDTAWMIVATALVLLMTIPGLALFYGGLVRRKNILNVLMQCFIITAVVSLSGLFVVTAWHSDLQRVL